MRSGNGKRHYTSSHNVKIMILRSPMRNNGWMERNESVVKLFSYNFTTIVIQSSFQPSSCLMLFLALLVIWFYYPNKNEKDFLTKVAEKRSMWLENKTRKKKKMKTVILLNELHEGSIELIKSLLERIKTKGSFTCLNQSGNLCALKGFFIIITIAIFYFL